MREAYAEAARRFGVTWNGRNYDRGDWEAADPVNRALSAANACLHGLVHAALLSSGYSPALGFVHQGKQLSFIYDIADLYKMQAYGASRLLGGRGGPALGGNAGAPPLAATLSPTCAYCSRIVPDVDRLLRAGCGAGDARWV